MIVPGLIAAGGQEAGAPPAGWSFGFNFATTPAPTQADEVAANTSAYPTVYNNGTHQTNAGWVNGPLAWDRNPAADRRLRGACYRTITIAFYVDLPAAGTYRCIIGCGDSGASGVSWRMTVQYYDQFGAVAAPPTPEFTAFSPNFAGTDGIVKSQAAWVIDADAVAVYKDMVIPASGPQARINLTAGSQYCGMSHVRLIQL